MIIGTKLNMDFDPMKMISDNAPEIAGSVIAFVHHFYVPAVVIMPDAGIWHMAESLTVSVLSGLIVHIIKPAITKFLNGKTQKDD